MTQVRTSVEVKGLVQLNEALRQLPREMTKRVLDGALKAGAAHIERDAERRAPVLQEPDPRRRPGVLKQSISTVARREAEGHAALVVVKPKRLSAAAIRLFKMASGRKGADNPSDPWYWWFVEFGTRTMAARPFLRPAFDAHKQRAVDTIHRQLGERLKRAWAKLGWRRRG